METENFINIFIQRAGAAAQQNSIPPAYAYVRIETSSGVLRGIVGSLAARRGYVC